MNFIISVLKKVFDFFCGDWRIFWGVTVTIILVELLEHFATAAYIKSMGGIVLVIGISLSLIIALKREIAK